MLWKAHYSTLIVPDAPALWPSESSPIVIGGFGPEDLSDMELWLRLMESESELTPHWKLDLSAFSREDKEDLIRTSWIKKSLAEKAAFWGDDWPRRAFAYCPPAGLLMIGPATEEAWDQFREAVLANLPKT